jgi:hypothetical protein
MYNNAQDVVQDILALEDRKHSTMCCMLWRWWLRRNKLNAKEQACTKENLKSQIRYWTQECDMHCRKMEKNMPPKEASKWAPPTQDVLKINIDGSFMQDSGQGGWGFVIRDASAG